MEENVRLMMSMMATHVNIISMVLSTTHAHTPIFYSIHAQTLHTEQTLESIGYVYRRQVIGRAHRTPRRNDEKQTTTTATIWHSSQITQRTYQRDEIKKKEKKNTKTEQKYYTQSSTQTHTQTHDEHVSVAHTFEQTRDRAQSKSKRERETIEKSES